MSTDDLIDLSRQAANEAVKAYEQGRADERIALAEHQIQTSEWPPIPRPRPAAACVGGAAMTTPNRPPLWQAMFDAGFNAPGTPRDATAAEIRVLRDWLLPEESIEDAPGRFANGCCLEDRQRLRALLTAEAYRAERGDV